MAIENFHESPARNEPYFSYSEVALNCTFPTPVKKLYGAKHKCMREAYEIQTIKIKAQAA